jgi:phosphoribosyl-ATP pyrophosphohydrolase
LPSEGVSGRVDFIQRKDFQMNDNDIFQKLFMIIESRKSESPDKSYVSSLMTKGIEKINSKIMEEAAEVCEAGIENDRNHTIYEICDLLFHTFVLAGYRNIPLQEIKAELERRFGTSGLEEKAGRKVK